MELREHWKTVSAHKWFVLGFAVFVGVAAFFFSLYRPEVYRVTVSFDVMAENRPATSDYQYGAYYDLKAAEIFTQNVMSWLITPAVVVDVYRTADVGYSIDNIDTFTNRFTTKQLAAQNFTVAFSDTSRTNGEKLAQAIVKVVEARSQEALTDQDGQPLFQVVGSEPVIAQSNFGSTTTTAVGVVVGLVLAIILVYLRKYFVGDEKSRT